MFLFQGRRNLKSFTLPPRESVAPPEVLVTSNVTEKDVDKEIFDTDDECLAGGTEGGNGGGPNAGGAGKNGDKKEAPTSGEKIEDFDDGGVPLIYLCATCWHETEGEMLSLLKSLFRYVNVKE